MNETNSTDKTKTPHLPAVILAEPAVNVNHKTAEKCFDIEGTEKKRAAGPALGGAHSPNQLRHDAVKSLTICKPQRYECCEVVDVDVAVAVNVLAERALGIRRLGNEVVVFRFADLVLCLWS